MEKFKKISAVTLFSILVALFMPKVVLADSALTVDGDLKTDIYAETGTKANKAVDPTAVYDADAKTLTLENYDGGYIDIDVALEKSDAIIVNLIGTNKIDLAASSNIGIDSNTSLIFTGDGTLEIDGGETGIQVNGNITIKNNKIVVKDSVWYAFYADGKTTIESDVDIDGVANGFTSAEGLDIEKGNINISAKASGITTADFLINDGNLKITIEGTEESDIGVSYGIISMGKSDINGGYIEINTPENGFAMASIGLNTEGLEIEEDPIVPELNISDDLVIIPEDNSIKNLSLDFIFDLKFDIITIGVDGANVYFNEETELEVENVAHNLIIKKKEEKIIDEENPQTGDNLSLYALLGISSLLSIIYISKKEVL